VDNQGESRHVFKRSRNINEKRKGVPLSECIVCFTSRPCTWGKSAE